MKIGAQLYTVRELCRTLDDFAETLKRVADIGYKTVQVSGRPCEFTAEWLKEQLDKNGLECVLTHSAAARFTDELEQVIQEHDVFSCKYMGLGGCLFNDENEADGGYRNFVDTFTPLAKKMKENGKFFMYHNHDHEFKKLDGKLIIERLAEDFPADCVGFTLDTFWVQAGGGDPAQWLERLSGRVPCIHLKDYSYGRKMAVIGEGNMNFDRIFEKAEAAGTKYMLVEQDNCNGEDPLDCLRRSYQYLRAMGFQ